MNSATREYPIKDLPELTEKVAKLNSKFERKGFDGRVSIDVKRNDAYQSFVRVNGIDIELVEVTVTIEGEITLGDYTLIGFSEHGLLEGAEVEEAFTINLSDVDIEDEIDFARCDHCQSHRNRSKLYIVADEAGSQFHIGSSCLDDYIDYEAHRLLTWAHEQFSGLLEEEEEEEMMNHVGANPSVHQAVCLAIAGIARHGYKKSSEPRSTKFFVESKWTESVDLVTTLDWDKVNDLAREAIEWAKNIEATNDFEANLKRIASAHRFDWKLLGFVVYLPMAYQREIERFQKAVEELSTRKELEEEGRFEIEGAIIWKGIKDSGYGTQVKVRVQDNRGFVVYGTLPKAYVEAGAEVDSSVKFIATVKKTPKDSTQGWFSRPIVEADTLR